MTRAELVARRGLPVQITRPAGTGPALSADDKMLYFASDRPGGKGGMDLWMIPTAQLKAK